MGTISDKIYVPLFRIYEFDTHYYNLYVRTTWTDFRGLTQIAISRRSVVREDFTLRYEVHSPTTAASVRPHLVIVRTLTPAIHRGAREGIQCWCDQGGIPKLLLLPETVSR